MVGSGEDVECSGQESGEADGDHGRNPSTCRGGGQEIVQVRVISNPSSPTGPGFCKRYPVSITVALLIAFVLLILNAFFVLVEFAIIKLRASRVEEMVDDGVRRAKLVQHIQSHLDEYLAVCQLGITVASLGLGAVAEPGFAQLIINLTGASSATAHTAAVSVAIVLFTALHVVLGEQVPKMLAILRAAGGTQAAKPNKETHR